MNLEKKQIDLPVILGKVIGHFGVQGWVKIFSYTKPKQAILEYKEMALKEKNHWKTLKIEEGRVHCKNVLIKIRNIENRERAEQVLGKYLGVSREDFPDLSDGHYYWTDLEGLEVQDLTGNKIGVISYMLETGANDVMVIENDDEILIPFLMDQVVKEVDFKLNRIVVDWDW